MKRLDAGDRAALRFGTAWCNIVRFAAADTLEGTVRNAETESARGSEVIFPVAVGAVFLAVLVIGAIVG